MSQQPRVPGTSPKIDPNTGLPPALNNTADDPNKVARDRERVISATAVAATGGEGEYAAPPALDDGPALRTATIDGQEVEVSLSPIRRNDHVVRYGSESKLPNGTPVNADGTVCEGTKEPFGIVGNIKTNQGWLVGRIIPLAGLKDAPKAA